MNKKDNIFFIIGAPRSGTTAITRILSMAENAEVHVEQPPKMCIESRELYKGSALNPEEYLITNKEPVIRQTLDKGLIYGDKNPNSLLFIPFMNKLWNPKYIFMIRDGREVVRSAMDYHKYLGGGIFNMKEDDPVSDLVSPEQNYWDYSRFRPNAGTPLHDKWQKLSRFEKYCWYWNEYNTILLKTISQLTTSTYMIVDISKLNDLTCEKIYTFLGLTGYKAGNISSMISSRINSIEEKSGKAYSFPHWQNWSTLETEIFNLYCGETMKELGFCHKSVLNT